MSETSSERLARLLTLVPWLRAHDGITIADAARHFQITPDQLTRDLWQLIVCGIPGYGPDQLVDIQFWDDDRIHVIDSMALDHPLRLTGEEVAALLMGLRMLAQVPGPHERQDVLTAMTKLESVGAPEISVDIAVNAAPGIVSAVQTAIDEGAAVRIGYASADRDHVDTRDIFPQGTYTVDGIVYVQAWCSTAEDVRTFRLDRIHEAIPLASVEVPKPDVVPTMTLPVTEPQDADVAEVHIDSAAAWILDTDPAVVASEPKPDGGYVGHVRFASLGWLVRWVLGHGGVVTVVEPVAARQAVHKAVRERLEAG